MDSARHVIKRTFNPPVSNSMACCDVASTIALGSTASYDVASTDHQSKPSAARAAATPAPSVTPASRFEIGLSFKSSCRWRLRLKLR